MPRSIYIHIPFCTQICYYCDFNKVFLKGQPVGEYLEALKTEMTTVFQMFPAQEIRTVFIGGGTPTALSPGQLEYLMQMIHQFVTVNPETEFTIEANPGDLSAEKLAVLKNYGVNRLSLGVQSFNDRLLKEIGRSHRTKDVYETVERARKTGFENISIDLMYGLPGQTLGDVKDSLQSFFDLQLEHCSAYSLIIEPKTVFYNLMNKGKLTLPPEELEAAMYETIMEEMDKHGFRQYEISNYAKEGFESKHNLVYWDNEEYYGFGAGAHSYINNARRSNIGPVNHYIKATKNGKLPVREENSLSKKEQIEEEMFLGLRKNQGVSLSRASQKFQINLREYYKKEIEELLKKRLITVENDHIKLTKQGRLLGNIVFQQFLK